MGKKKRGRSIGLSGTSWIYSSITGKRVFFYCLKGDQMGLGLYSNERHQENVLLKEIRRKKSDILS